MELTIADSVNPTPTAADITAALRATPEERRHRAPSDGPHPEDRVFHAGIVEGFPTTRSCSSANASTEASPPANAQRRFMTQ